MSASDLPQPQLNLQELVASIKPSYARFLFNDSDVPARILLTGHSHQAWPDVARDGVLEAFEDASRHVDDKWGAVFEKAEVIRQEIASLTGTLAEEIALAQNTHELFTRFLSALPLRERPLIIATDGEFHSVYRQLCAAQQAGLIEVQWIDCDQPDEVSAKMRDAVRQAKGRCAAVVTSSVLFQTSAIVTHLDELAQTCLEDQVRLFIDAYHSFKVVPISLQNMGAAESIVYLSGGGYKYAQWGEGVCWMRVPNDDELKPIFTGWFSDFSNLHQPRYDTMGQAREIGYGGRPADRFAGSTFDPTSLYRASKVIEFFHEQGLDIHTLRTISLHQTQRLIDGLSSAFQPITPVKAERRGGFVAFYVENAHQWSNELRAVNIFTDARGNALRFGPAPYLSDDDLDIAIARTLQVAQKRGI